MVPVWYFSVQLKEAEDDVRKDLQAQQLELQQRNMNDRYSRFTIKRPRQHKQTDRYRQILKMPRPRACRDSTLLVRQTRGLNFHQFCVFSTSRVAYNFGADYSSY